MADGPQLDNRFVQRQRAARWRQLAGCLFLRVPLVNPDTFLERTVAYAAAVYASPLFVVWLVMMIVAASILFQRWDNFCTRTTRSSPTRRCCSSGSL